MLRLFQRSKANDGLKLARKLSGSFDVFSKQLSVASEAAVDLHPPQDHDSHSSFREQRFIDKVHIQAQGGRGGSGGNTLGSPTRGRHRPPNGGNGGSGGDVVVRATSRVSSLAGLNHLHRGKNGGHGKGEKTAGARGADTVIQVPLGTVVYLRKSAEQSTSLTRADELPDWIRHPGQPWLGAEDSLSGEESTLSEGPSRDSNDLDEFNSPYVSSEEDLKARLGEEIADLDVEGESVVLAKGGQGGRGNAHMPRKRSRWKDEDIQQQGATGERVVAHLEMRILCDIGLVGAPNAGKSSLLRVMSAASPKVASYPFTTLQPHLGSIEYQDSTFTIADIPGLISGAAENRGLGHSFLRHISRASALAYVVDLSAGFPEDKLLKPWDQLASLQAELGLYNPDLLHKPALVIANKIDLLRQPLRRIAALERRFDLPVCAVSALHTTGIDILKAKLRDLSLQ